MGKRSTHSYPIKWSSDTPITRTLSRSEGWPYDRGNPFALLQYLYLKCLTKCIITQTLHWIIITLARAHSILRSGHILEPAGAIIVSLGSFMTVTIRVTWIKYVTHTYLWSVDAPTVFSTSLASLSHMGMVTPLTSPNLRNAMMPIDYIGKNLQPGG